MYKNISVDTLVDLIDDRIDYSCKIDLCPPTIKTIVSVDTIVDAIADLIKSSSNIDLCPPSVEAIVLNDSTSSYENCLYQLMC